jgi:hypothetical protein
VKLDDYSVGLRVLDIEHGFRETRPDPVIQSELANSLLLGKALNLALHLRGFNVIEDIRGLRYAAAELGVGSTELTTILGELQEIEWVRIVGPANNPKRVEVLVPALRDGFEIIGARWRDLNPTEIEQGSVMAVSEAVVRPYTEEQLIRTLGNSKELAGTVLDIGEAGTFLRLHRLDGGERIVYSPQYGDNNPEKAIALVEKYGDDKVKNLIAAVHQEQGVPAEFLTQDDKFVKEAMLSGLVLVPAVRDKQFVFTPQKGLVPEETVILDKARAIVSCVRFGQRYAEITKIFSPAAIVSALISRKKLKPHTEHLEQYGLLVKKGIGRVDKIGSKWQFRVSDTEDNMKALRVARDLLDTGDAIHQQVDDEAQAKIINPSASYSTPVAQRVKLNRSAKTRGADDKTARAISDLIRGAISE